MTTSLISIIGDIKARGGGKALLLLFCVELPALPTIMVHLCINATAMNYLINARKEYTLWHLQCFMSLSGWGNGA